MNAAPTYLLGVPKNDTRFRHGKLTMSDVNEIRRWAGTEGHGLGIETQCEIMAPLFGVKPSTVRDLLQNMSWRDVSYIPGKRLEEACGTQALTAPAFTVRFLLWLRLLCFFGDGSCGSGTGRHSK